MQNIILEELENLKGILIATTNLAVNMDKAFDRRFLFKVEFKNPDEVTRVKLWKSMLPELNEKDRMVLGRQFKLSGGQIENITRKYLLDKAIFDKKLHIDDMVKYCKEEVPEKLEMKIGF
jgi:SpoVK/Ycf46/Vps4 family AAA+-type ATPase